MSAMRPLVEPGRDVALYFEQKRSPGSSSGGFIDAKSILYGSPGLIKSTDVKNIVRLSASDSDVAAWRAPSDDAVLHNEDNDRPYDVHDAYDDASSSCDDNDELLKRNRLLLLQQRL
jgi:hypothetical protein